MASMIMTTRCVRNCIMKLLVGVGEPVQISPYDGVIGGPLHLVDQSVELAIQLLKVSADVIATSIALERSFKVRRRFQGLVDLLIQTSALRPGNPVADVLLQIFQIFGNLSCLP